MKYLPEILLIIGVLACAVAAFLAWGWAPAVAVVGVSCIAVAFLMDKAGKR